MAMQSKPQRVKGIKKSPKAGQGESKNMLEPSKYKLEQKAESMKHARLQRGITLYLLKPNMACLGQHKTELHHVKISLETY